MMTTDEEMPPWAWDTLPSDEFRELWGQLVEWVDWLQEAYAPWIVLPACWPSHEGLSAELILFWYWHYSVTSEAHDPTAGVQWHADLRVAAHAWRELATCAHEPPLHHQERTNAADRARRDGHVKMIVTRHAEAVDDDVQDK